MKNLAIISSFIFLSACGGGDDKKASPQETTSIPTLSISVPEYTNDNTPSISGTTNAAPATTVSITVSNNNNVIENLTPTVNADGSFNIDVTSPLDDGEFLIEASVSNTAGTTNKSDSGIIDTVAPALTIVLDTQITDDDQISAAEKDQTIDINGTVAGEFSVTDLVTLSVDSEKFAGPVNSDGQFKISIPGITLFLAEEHVIRASMEAVDLAGNSTTALDTETYKIETETTLLTALVEDCFTCSTDLPYGSHGNFVLNVIKGIAHNLPAISNVEYLTHEINDGYSSDVDFAPQIHLINISSSTHQNSEDLIANRIQAFSPFPLIVTSAGNGGNECSVYAAQIGRDIGLSAFDLGNGTENEHPDIEILYKACDMQMIAAMDLNIAENWIVVGGDFIGGQRPGVYKHRWIAAPYRNLGSQGTSFGTPLVSYYASLIQSRMPFLEPNEVANIIFDTADKTGMYSDSDEFGHGLINPEAIEAYLTAQGY